MAVLISMGVAIVPGIVLFGIYFAGVMNILNPFVFLTISVILMIVTDGLLLYYLFTKGVEKFKKIN